MRMRLGTCLHLWVCLCAMYSDVSEAKVYGAVRKTTNRIVIHTISGPICKNGMLAYSGAFGDVWQWKRFFDTHPFLGVHYIIDRKGQVASSTPERLIANHALDHNEDTIGIELVHNGDGIEPFSAEQISALMALLKQIMARHAIALHGIVSHAELDKRTFACGERSFKSRTDPGDNFPWVKIRDALRGERMPKLIREPTLVEPRKRAP